MSLCYLLPMSLCRANYYPYLSFPEYETRNIRYVDGYYVYPSEIGSEGPTATHVRSLDLTSWEEVSGFQELVEEPWASIGDIGLGYFDPVFDDISGEYDPYITFDGGETYTVIPSNFLVQDIIATEDAFYLCQSYKITELSLIDLSVQNVAIRYDETPGPDVPITVEFDVSNLGLVDYLRTGELKVSVVLTQSEFLDAGANYTLFESTLEPPLAVGESLHFSQEVYLPRELSAGDFHIGVFADSADRLSELNESNNIYFSPTSLINIPHVTLTVNSADGGSVLAGSSLPNGLALSDGSSGLSVLSGALELPFNLQLNLLAQPAKNYVFAGWEEYPNQGEDPLNLNLMTDITLTPVFRSLISVSTSVQGSGTVQTTPTDTSDLASGQVVSLLAVPDEGWTFLEWEGDLNSTSSSASITATTSKQVRAVFYRNVLRFEDWKTDQFTIYERPNTSVSDRTVDADGDGYSNLFEYLFRTDPKSSEDRPDIDILFEDDLVSFEFETDPRISDYEAVIFSSPDLNMWDSETHLEDQTTHHSFERADRRVSAPIDTENQRTYFCRLQIVPKE